MIKISRSDQTVIATSPSGKVMRRYACRSLPCAVSLELKLNIDPEFADWWAHTGDPKAGEHVPHGLERPWSRGAGLG